jgi:hypothetical protein
MCGSRYPIKNRSTYSKISAKSANILRGNWSEIYAVPLHCQQELHKQDLAGARSGENPKDANLARVLSMHWVTLYSSVGHDRC